MVACASRAPDRCHYPKTLRPISARADDTVAFSVLLSNVSAIPLSWAKLRAHLDTERVSMGGIDNQKVVGLTITWDGEASPFHAPPVVVRLRRIGDTSRLDYQKGSAVLFSAAGKVLAHLPDDLFTRGIVLGNLGPPRSCFNCNETAARFVNFKMRVR